MQFDGGSKKCDSFLCLLTVSLFMIATIIHVHTNTQNTISASNYNAFYISLSAEFFVLQICTVLHSLFLFLLDFIHYIVFSGVWVLLS